MTLLSRIAGSRRVHSRYELLYSYIIEPTLIPSFFASSQTPPRDSPFFSRLAYDYRKASKGDVLAMGSAVCPSIYNSERNVTQHRLLRVILAPIPLHEPTDVRKSPPGLTERPPRLLLVSWSPSPSQYTPIDGLASSKKYLTTSARSRLLPPQI